MLQPEEDESWRGTEDDRRIWRGKPDPNRLQPASHPWSYRRTTMVEGMAKQERARESFAEPLNKPTPRRQRRSKRRHGEVRAPVGQAARNADVTHCPHGHEYTPENTYVSYTPRGWVKRRCRTCALDADRAKRAARPPKPERVAVPSPTCRRGHPWTPESTFVRGGAGKLAGTRLCRRCRNWRHDKRVLELMRVKANARADEARAWREAEARALDERRLRMASLRANAVMRERRFLLHRWSPDEEPGYRRTDW